LIAGPTYEPEAIPLRIEESAEVAITAHDTDNLERLGLGAVDDQVRAHQVDAESLVSETVVSKPEAGHRHELMKGIEEAVAKSICGKDTVPGDIFPDLKHVLPSRR
jgi:hypothetical protein